MNEGFLIKTSTSNASGSGSSTSSKTPYEIAVENGYEGTEQEFNNALTKIDQVIYYEEKGNVDGVASLGDDGKVPYFQLPDFVKTEDKGKAGGVASLGDDGKVPANQLPDNIGGGGGVGKTFVGTAKIPDNGDITTDFDYEVEEETHAEIFNDYRTPVYGDNRHIAKQPWLEEGNIATNDYSTAVGSANITTNQYSFIGGFSCTDFDGGNSSNFTFGTNCSNTGYYNALFGLDTHIMKQENDDFSMQNIVCGFTLNVKGSANAVFGQTNTVTNSSYNLVGGTWNNVTGGSANVVTGYMNKLIPSTDYPTGSTNSSIICGQENTTMGHNNFFGGTENIVTDFASDNNIISGSGNTLYAEESIISGTNCSIISDSFARLHNCLVIGNECKAIRDNSFAGGVNAIAGGYNSIAYGSGATTESSYTAAFNAGTASGGYSFACGMSSATGECSFAAGNGMVAGNYGSATFGKFGKDMTTGAIAQTSTGDVLTVGNGTWRNNVTTKSNAFRITYAGETYGLSAFNSTGADYAEYFEWLDNNPDNQDRVGYFVALVDDKIVFANSGDYILGVVSGQPCIIGNSDEDWLGRWEHDEFDRFIKEYLEDTEVEIEAPENDEERMKLLSQPNIIQKDNKIYRIDTTVVDYETPSWRYKENPDYDSSQSYIERKDRKEWSAVGMMGVLAVRDDGTCSVNGYCKVDNGGTATSADEYIPGQTWRVIKRVSENVIKIIFK